MAERLPYIIYFEVSIQCVEVWPLTRYISVLNGPDVRVARVLGLEEEVEALVQGPAAVEAVVVVVQAVVVASIQAVVDLRCVGHVSSSF